MYLTKSNIKRVVALLFIGSAILLFSCKNEEAHTEENSTQNMMTLNSENLTIINSKEGMKNYKFTTPLLERYELASEPYTEFRKGIHIEKFNDSTHLVESMLSANYAIFLENVELWEAKGNVIGENAKGQRLETEQLFWDQRAKRIYSNVDSKITDLEGTVIIGDGFESDEAMNEFTFRRVKGVVSVESEPQSDSVKIEPTKEAIKVVDNNTDKNKVEIPTIREGEAVAKPKK